MGSADREARRGGSRRGLAGLICAAAVCATAASATAAPAVPVVWVQAGHEAPGEPGYRWQTGAGGGPFGSEVRFTVRLAGAVEARLRASGVDARHTPARVTPLGARGATFISLHMDAVGGYARIGHAITGAGENWYHGEGAGAPSPVPYSDSAAHRPPTTVSAAVERRSRALAQRLSARLGPTHTAANGATSRFGGVEPRTGNPRMMRFYGYYRTRSDARVLVECGASGADDRYLARVDLIARAVADGIVDDLKARGLLR